MASSICNRCNGTRLIDDAEPGDISYNEFPCPECLEQSSESELTNDSVRALLAQKNITVENVTNQQLEELAILLRKSLVNSGNYRNTYALDYPPKDLMYMTCSTEQWKGRECVSFNRDGFIGFTGWADDKNTKPILEAVVEWVESISIKGAA
jgi:hypothetical protein